ncbi:HAAS signaling domain-containing protein [Dactylosporangium sp. CS-033363]|uniref:HAAS signaling domain-containing protein n=1 Tax=Dactylosporangium sp. CS-033363 TaxID=3239935 RepID=UPI003D8CE89B
MTAPSDSSLEIDFYLERVAAALADLPQEVRDDLLEDLPAHFAEVLEEQGGSLVERLGPPAEYAAELRAAAGIESTGGAGGAVRAGIDLDKVRERLRIADERSGRVIGYERASDFLRLLRPAWWVARGVAVVVLIFALDIIPTDRLDDPIGWVLIAAAVIVSVRLGATGRPRMHRFVGYGITALGILGVLVMGANLDRLGGSTYYTPNSSYNPYENVRDVYPVDENGRPLHDVVLYDQDGNVITIGDPYRCATDQYGDVRATVPAYPLCPIGRFDPSPSVAPSAAPSVAPSASSTPSAVPSVSPSR